MAAESEDSRKSDVGEWLAVRHCEDDDRLESLNCLRMTTLESSSSGLFVNFAVSVFPHKGLAIESPSSSSDGSSMYSGRCVKLSGMTMT